MAIDRSPAARDRVSHQLRAGLRGLEGLPQVTIVDDFIWVDDLKSWAICIRLSLPALGPRNLAVTDWYFVIEEPYPWAKIHVFPALEGGIAETYPHQRVNEPTAGLPFRNGAICVQTGLQSLDRRSFDREPLEPHVRLRWNVERAIAWVEAASANELMLPGEPFELPDFPIADTQEGCVSFLETPASFAEWQGVARRWGTVRATGSRDNGTFHVISFDGEPGESLMTASWGTHVSGVQPLRGLWVRLGVVPALDPWRAPATWGELREVCQQDGLDLDRALRSVIRHVRDNRPNIALVGFPIPRRVGEPPTLLHWQGLLLPKLDPRDTAGFRAGETGKWNRDRTQALGPSKRLDWLTSQNWTADELSRRGGLSQALRQQRVLVLGAGALGSVVAELLVRGGAHDLAIIDDDNLEAGNLVRHTLSLHEVCKAKAPALAARLNALSPHARAQGHKARFPKLNAEAQAFAESCTLVVDCTANDQVAHHDLEQFPWRGPRKFVSISLGLDARRLFCFTSSEERFPSTAFAETTTPWLSLERRENAGRELPREGTGCWNPVFPARLDDIWAMAGLALRRIERVLADAGSTELVVFERTDDGYRRAVMPP